MPSSSTELRVHPWLVSYRPLARWIRRSCRLPHEGVVRVCHIYSSLLLGGPARRLFLFQRSSGSVPRQRLAHNALARRSSARTRRRGAGPAPRRTAGRAPGPLVRRVVDPPRADAAPPAARPRRTRNPRAAPVSRHVCRCRCCASCSLRRFVSPPAAELGRLRWLPGAFGQWKCSRRPISACYELWVRERVSGCQATRVPGSRFRP